jgi:hypothetical protein
MGEQQHSLTRLSSGGNPSWAAVVVNTIRLWRKRHQPQGVRSLTRWQRGVMILCAVLAMGVGAVVTLAFTQSGRHAGQPSAQPTNPANALQAAAANRNQAASWVAQQVLPSVLIGCDPLMCKSLQAAGVSASRLSEIMSSAADPLGVEVIVATPALRSQFGPRLATVYAPLVLASFGAGAQQIAIRYLEPAGANAFEQSLASAQQARVEAGEQLLGNKNIQASAQARAALIAGQVDPRLLVTLGLLAHEMPVQLLLFDDSSPGASPEVPFRGAKIGASAPAGLTATLAFLAQQTTYQPSQYGEVRFGGSEAVSVQYDAPGPLGLDSP